MHKVVLVHNMHENLRSQGSVWFVSDRYKGDPSPWYFPDKVEGENAIRILGPVDIKVAGEVTIRIKTMLRNLGVEFDFDETADD